MLLNWNLICSKIAGRHKNLDVIYQEYVESLQSISLSEDDFIDALDDYKALDTFRTELHALDEASIKLKLYMMRH